MAQPTVLRLTTRPQFQAVMAAGTVARTVHFALHRLALPAAAPGAAVSAVTPRPANMPEGWALFGAAARASQSSSTAQQPWLGALVPKRWARRAVTRNTIKRQIYATGAAFEPSMPLAAHVVRLRSGFARSEFPSASSDALKKAVRAELQQLFTYAQKKPVRVIAPEGH